MFIAETPNITISATIGSPKMVIYGYAPSDSNVLLNGIGVSSNTQADSTGYYLFDAVYTYDFSYPEICIQAIDEKKRTTQPTCIPPLPATELVAYEVGPVLLSPTISLSQNSIVKRGQASMEGKTSPNKEVNIYIAKKENRANFSLVPIANAYTIPMFQTKSDKDGDFTFSLPTVDSSSYKIFVSGRFGDNLSAKSNTLTFVVMSRVEFFINWLIGWILSNKLLVVIIVEVIVITILVIKLLKPITVPLKV
ncbi:MAG: hypothetical protein Q8L01_03735 [Candidatus Woesebacteria bacterium]|nr:hypothetical protein [Candidatus Woesebacteria bacterium]